MSRYPETYARWQRDPIGFWAEAAEEIDWFRRWDKVLDDRDAPLYRWFTGAECNTCFNCLDRHVAAGRAEQPALIHDSPLTGTIRTLTYGEMLREVRAIAGGLRRLGVGKGDCVILYMPMVPEAVMAMLACARLGAIHCVVFGGFAAHELATRIKDVEAKAVVSASCGIEPGRVVPYKPLLDEAIELLPEDLRPTACVIVQRPMEQANLVEGRDHTWDAVVGWGLDAECVPVLATDPLYVIHTSGTTGQPKGVVRDNGGNMVALKWSMRNIFGVEPGEVFWAASDVGWVVGHSYICYGPLLNGNTTILFEGKPVGAPDAGVYWRLIEQHKVRALFTAPTAFRAIRREDPDGALIAKHDLSGFRTLFLAGEHADPETVQWAERQLKVPVIDHWWQTETGWPVCANPAGLGLLPMKYGSCFVPMPGWDVRVLDDAGKEVAPETIGNVVLRLPLPPGSLPFLWNNEERYRSAYLTEFAGYYKTGDAGYRDADGYTFIMSRTDDIINVAGHRLSTGAMEEVLAGHADVAECAVIGIADRLKGQVPLGFVVLKAGTNRPIAEIERELVQRVRTRIGPVAAFKQALVVQRLPKTRSGKILRATMRQIAERQPYTMPATIDDPAILGEIAQVLESGLVGDGPAA